MTTRPPFYVSFTRLAVTVFLVVLIAYICIAAAISVGYSVFWERERRQQIPENPVHAIETQDTALACARGLRLFNNELLFNVRRFIKTYAGKPQYATEIWDRWLTEWQHDYDEFGRRYGFSGSLEAMTPTHREFAETYRELAVLAARYAAHFRDLSDLHGTQRRDLRTQIEALETRWREHRP